MRMWPFKDRNEVGRFGKFALVWYAQQFAIPFWVVGHVHLHFANYHIAVKAVASALMHIAVAVGFWLDWRESSSGGDS